MHSTLSKWIRLCLVALCLIVSVALAACNQAPAEEASTTTEDVTSTTSTESETESEEATTMEDTTQETTTEEVTTEESTTQEDSTEEDTTVKDTTEEVTTEAPIVDVMIGETLDADYAADFSVSNVFSNDMVVQRNEHLRVWGTAPESENGKKISGEFKGMFAETLIEDGEWVLTFGARLEASAELGHSMLLYTDTKVVEFADVLVGDVYMVIGQSNVAYSLQDHWTYKDLPDLGGRDSINEDLPIRLHYNALTQMDGYPTRGTEEVCDELRNGEVWQRATMSNLPRFSAIGYFFAMHLTEITEAAVPVGIIEINGNGMPLGTFMCNEVANARGTDTFDEEKGYYVTTGANGNQSRYMYNHYMNPFEKYALAGIVWYQGESDFEVANAKVFAQNFAALMTYMRSTHNLINQDFPVFLVEFPTNFTPYDGFVTSPSEPFWAYMDVGLIRAVLGSIPRILPNSYLSVSIDLWTDNTFFNSLHPNCKFEQGQRTAQIAAAVMGLGNMDEAVGPTLVDITLFDDGRTAVLTYENVGEGLTTTDGGTTVRGISMLDTSYAVRQDPLGKLQASITSYNQVTVTCPIAIKGLAYSAMFWNEYDKDVNLCNSYGTPAGGTLIFAK